MEAIRSSETSDLTKATRRNIPEDVIPHKLYVRTQINGKFSDRISAVENKFRKNVTLMKVCRKGRGFVSTAR
jgi:hypothetical protein